MREGPVETYDSRTEAEAAETAWAAQIVKSGFAGRYGACVRFIRTGYRRACWGIFIEPIGGGA